MNTIMKINIKQKYLLLFILIFTIIYNIIYSDKPHVLTCFK